MFSGFPITLSIHFPNSVKELADLGLPCRLGDCRLEIASAIFAEQSLNSGVDEIAGIFETKAVADLASKLDEFKGDWNAPGTVRPVPVIRFGGHCFVLIPIPAEKYKTQAEVQDMISAKKT